MSTILPRKPLARVAFYENHVADWQANAAAIGTTTTAVTSLTTLTTAARAAYNAQQVAIDAARAATQNYYDAVAAMDNAGSDIIKAIKAKAAVGGNAVYTLALLPVPATPSPRPAPGTPSDFTATLLPDGSLELAWRCANPSGSVGTMYQVSRRIGGSGSFVALGSCGTRKFADTSVPAGVASITYQVQAARSTAVGAAAQFLVNFGVDGGEASVASVVSAPKLAA